MKKRRKKRQRKRKMKKRLRKRKRKKRQRKRKRKKIQFRESSQDKKLCKTLMLRQKILLMTWESELKLQIPLFDIHPYQFSK